MNAAEALDFLPAGATLLFLIFSTIFVFKTRREGMKCYLPFGIFAIWLLLSLVIPETGFSDIRSQWHLPAALVPYSCLYILLAALRCAQEIPLCLRLRSGQFFTRCVALTDAVLSLKESWDFYHGVN